MNHVWFKKSVHYQICWHIFTCLLWKSFIGWYISKKTTKTLFVYPVKQGRTSSWTVRRFDNFEVWHVLKRHWAMFEMGCKLHCSNLARQKWAKFWPYGPQNISFFFRKVSLTKFDINQMTNIRIRAKTFHCSNLARQKWAKTLLYGPQNNSSYLFCHKSLSYKLWH